MDSRALTISVVGAGMIGKCHALALMKNQRARLRAICDVNVQLAEALAKECGVPAVSDYGQLLADKQLDAVVIATPPWLHHEMALGAARAGKHVLCEKPFAIFPWQAEEMVAAGREKGIVLADCSARHARLNPRFRRIHALIQEGRLGNVYFIKYTSRWRRNRSGIEYHPTAKWFLDKSKAGGGVAINAGIYDLSFMYGLFDDHLRLQEVMAFANREVDDVDPGTPVYDIEEHLGAMLRFENGPTIMWETAKACHGAPRSYVEIFGTRGGICTAPLNWDPLDMVLFDDGPSGARDVKLEIPEAGEYAADDLHYIDDDFVDAVLDGRRPAMPGECAAEIIKTLDAVYRKIGLR